MRRERGGLVFLCLLIGLSYWAANFSFSGPAYLSDEIGYLSKAASLAGWSVFLPTGWHGGYSLLLLPAFLLFDDPAAIFRTSVFINALLWTITFGALAGILQRLYPTLDRRRRLGAIGLCAIYPAWIVSCGYAISTTALAMLFTLSVLGLLHQSWGGTVLHSLCAGFLFWCHPTGLALALASLLAQLLTLRRERASKLVLSATLVGSLVVVYSHGIGPWFERVMIPEGEAVFLVSGTGGGKYTTTGFAAALSNLTFYKHLLVMLMGQVSYFLVSTFGLGLYGVSAVIERLRRAEERPALSYLILSFVGLIAMGTLYLAKLSCEHSTEGIHTWFYGRYQEIAWVPLLAIGVLNGSAWPRRLALLAASQALLTGLLLHLLLTPVNTDWSLIYLNVQGFWPLVYAPDLKPWIWFVIGAVGITLVALLPKKVSYLVIVPSMLLMSALQLQQHHQILSDYSRPNDMRSLVRALYPRSTLIGLDPTIADPERPGDQKERQNYYSFYLYDYPQRKLEFQKWLQEPRGPYLTFNQKKAALPGVKAVALEHKTGLLLLVPSKVASDLLVEQTYQGITVDSAGTGRLALGCFTLNSPELAIFSATGVLTEKGMTTDGGTGPLFYGPYLPLRGGSYQLVLKGEFLEPAEAVLDVTSEAGQSLHLQAEVGTAATQTFPFELSQDVAKLEVRLFVHPASQLSVSSYAIEPSNPNSIP